MISDKLSVGPPQIQGDIDIFNVQDKAIFKDKKEFEDLLNKKDIEPRETSGGTNRRMSERKIDKNPESLSDQTEKEEKELQPTSNPMAYQQNRVEVVDFDKNPSSIEVLDSDLTAVQTNQKLEVITPDLFGEEALQFQNEAVVVQPQLALTEAIEAQPVVSEEVLNPFQADVFQALQQDMKTLSTESALQAMQTKDLSEVLNPEVVPVAADSTTEVNANLLSAQVVPSVSHAGDQQSQQFTQQQFEQSFTMNQSQPQIEKTDAETKDEFKLNDSLQSSNVNQDGLQSMPIASSQTYSTQQTNTPTAFAVDKPGNPVLTQNTAEIVKQAEFLVKEGGGTAKIRMTPEGLGSVDLRVTLNEGKVQIEMHTADPQAKKLLQESITDLKSSLASHNFNLDHVKINNMSATADLNNQQSHSQSFLNQQHSSQSQSQSWNQFEGQMQQQLNRESRDTQDSEPALESRRQNIIAPKIARGYGIATKSSSLNMVA